MNRLKTGKAGSLLKRTEFSLVVIIVVIFLVAAFGTDNFLTNYNLTNILKQCSIIGVISISATFIIITGGIDLSCGAICGMSTLMVAMGQAKWGMSVPVSILLALAVSVVCGLYNAVIINEFQVPPFIATLGSMTILRGLIKVISNASTIAGLNKKFGAFASESAAFIPKLAVIWVIVVLIGFLILHSTTFGRNLYVLGSGQEVARLCGISIRRVTYMTYGIAGLLCGIAGIMLASRINSAVPTAGTGYEMNAIAASVIGGASLSGAKGSVWGTALGTILMTLIDNAGIQFGINSFIMEISTGVLITIAVIIDQLKNKKSR
ncbi:sugar ABC transporter permease [Lachnospiraceae bacterium]|uniref:ABC transporter permease n=1 Tax=Extibacter sp. GGCC_0201 TaxID=2731209 RepID=UPI001AA0B85C|nr:ABC transporter permease [Extibacter sp. GGCC_0201]MBO1720339.1 ABC transporter permease [Extibacter sp. GGCC_0201]BDF34440.1 sugar ABC transporter permease [Lachnospiraceae bacterium]BDF38442.1 sugar ABC transporter permease [Lachnospiraceae bacterium]